MQCLSQSFAFVVTPKTHTLTGLTFESYVRAAQSVGPPLLRVALKQRGRRRAIVGDSVIVRMARGSPGVRRPVYNVRSML